MNFVDSSRKAYSVMDPLLYTTSVVFLNDSEIQSFIEANFDEDDEESLIIRREFRYDRYNDVGKVPESVLVNDGFPVHCVCGSVVTVYKAHYVSQKNHVYCSDTCFHCMENLNPQFVDVIHKVVEDNPGIQLETSTIYKEKKVESLKFKFPGSKHENIITGKMGRKYLNFQIVLNEKDIDSWNEFQSLFEDT